MPRNIPAIGTLRRRYHRQLASHILAYRTGSTVLNIADGSSPTSCELAAGMVAKMGVELRGDAPDGQTAGSDFAKYTCEFVQTAFERLAHVRPGPWRYFAGEATSIHGFDQYRHLAELREILDRSRDIKAALGNMADYIITPDIVVAREPLSDEEINRRGALLDPHDPRPARLTPLRAANADGTAAAIIHASISCKWTMRSDRAQNVRTEALNLMRNRKGKTPHIMAVTIEPLPSRLASIALGTGDVDCTYHAALYELLEAAAEGGREEAHNVLRVMVDGRRLRDVSDLPFDLAS